MRIALVFLGFVVVFDLALLVFQVLVYDIYESQVALATLAVAALSTIVLLIEILRRKYKSSAIVVTAVGFSLMVSTIFAYREVLYRQGYYPGLVFYTVPLILIVILTSIIGVVGRLKPSLLPERSLVTSVVLLALCVVWSHASFSGDFWLKDVSMTAFLALCAASYWFLGAFRTWW